jgi:hypothetical protein
MGPLVLKVGLHFVAQPRNQLFAGKLVAKGLRL